MPQTLTARVHTIEIVTADGETQEIIARIIDGPEDLIGRKIRVQLESADTFRVAVLRNTQK